MRISKHQWAMRLAQVTSLRSTCARRSVGCILTNERGHVLSTGYNGVAIGMPHCNDPSGFYLCSGTCSESGKNLDACRALHAEQNALLQCPDVFKIHSAYVTASPCITCTKLLLNTSCKNVYYYNEYPHQEARELWESSGRLWIKTEL